MNTAVVSIKRYVFAFLLLIVVFLIVLLISKPKSTTIQPPPSTNNIPPIESSYKQTVPGITIHLPPSLQQNLKIPSQLPIYSSSNTNNEEFIRTLSLSLNLTQHPLSANLWLNNNTSLNYTKEIGLITITSTKDSPSKRGFDRAQLISQINKNAELLHINIFTDPQSITFTNNTADYIDANTNLHTQSSNALYAIVPFQYQIDNYPIYLESLKSTDQVMIVNSNYEVVKINFYPPPQLLFQSNKNTITFEELLKNLSTEGGTYIDISSNTMDPIDGSTIKSINVSGVNLEYRIHPTSNIATPYFNLSGVGADTANKQHVLQIIVPAITSL